MTLPDIERVLKELSPEEVIDNCGLGEWRSPSNRLVDALADHIEENQEAILENLEISGVV